MRREFCALRVRRGISSARSRGERNAANHPRDGGIGRCNGGLHEVTGGETSRAVYAYFSS